VRDRESARADLAALDEFEVAVRNLVPAIERMRAVLSRWDQPRYTEALAPVAQWIARCSPDFALRGLERLRQTIEWELKEL
jgi:hypothetical protein